MDEDEKSRLELRVLQRRLSWPARLRDWLQAIGTIAAFATVAWAMGSYVLQMKETRREKQFEELSQTLTQMGGDLHQRASGASQLGFLMNDASLEPIVRERALAATVVALSVEEDPVVRDILAERIRNLRVGLFRSIDIKGIEQDLLDRNRELAGYLSDEDLGEFIVWRLKGSSYQYKPSPEAIELETTGQALALLVGIAANQTSDEAADKAADVAGFSNLICLGCSLRSKGAVGLADKIRDELDLSGLVCIGCSFRSRGTIRLKFSHAIFANTQFAGLGGRQLDLRGSDFSRSSHYNTVFNNVNVEGVNFTFKIADSKIEPKITKGFVGAGNRLPEMTFINAKRGGADFTGRGCLARRVEDVEAYQCTSGRQVSQETAAAKERRSR